MCQTTNVDGCMQAINNAIAERCVNELTLPGAKPPREQGVTDCFR